MRHEQLAGLAMSYLSRAHEELLATQSKYAELSAQTGHMLQPRQLMALVVDAGGPMAEKVMAHPLVLKALTLLKKRALTAKSSRDPLEWSLFRLVDEAESRRVADAVREDSISRLAHCLDHQRYPEAPGTALKLYFTHKMLGNENRADSLYEAARASGAPLPSRSH